MSAGVWRWVIPLRLDRGEQGGRIMTYPIRDRNFAVGQADIRQSAHIHLISTNSIMNTSRSMDSLYKCDSPRA